MSIARLLSKFGRFVNSNGLLLPEAYVNGGGEFYSNNLLINGSFNVWQKGTTVSNWGSFGYPVDNVQIGYDGTPASGRTVTRQAFTPGQTDIPEGDPLYYLEYSFPNCGTPTNYLRFPVESVRTLAGKQATFSFWARTTAGSMPIGSAICQEFGSGGSPSAGVYPALTTYNLNTTWQKIRYTTVLGSIAGKTLGTNNNDMIWPAIWCPTNAAGTIQLANLKLEPGSVATPFQRRPTSVDLALCQRYYERRTVGSQSNERLAGTGLANGSTSAQFPIQHYVQKRATPSINVVNLSGTATYDGSASGNPTGWSVDNTGLHITNIQLTGLTTALGRAIHWTWLNNTPLPYIEISSEL